MNECIAEPTGATDGIPKASLPEVYFPERKQGSPIAASNQVLASHSFFGSGINSQASLYSEMAASWAFS